MPHHNNITLRPPKPEGSLPDDEDCFTDEDEIMPDDDDIT
jgi:hypothetical protein